MNRKLAVILLVIFLGMVLGFGLFADSGTVAGYGKITVTATHRTEPLVGAVWYPTGHTADRSLIGDNAVFQGTPAVVGVTPGDGKFPLVVMSHGTGGSMDDFAWLASQLAVRGAMVVAINHPGSTTGDLSPQRTKLTDRATDLKATVTHILADPVFGPHIDPTRIISLGFSLGGATALNLAGVRMDRGLYQNYCATFGDAAMDCVFLAKGGVNLKDLPSSFEEDMRDQRITAAIAVDPGMTYSMTKESIAAMGMSVLLINLGNNAPMKSADVSAQGSNLAAKLPRAEYATVTPASHFTFLRLCKPEGSRLLAERHYDPVCGDPTGTDRAKIHQEIIDRIAAFLKL